VKTVLAISGRHASAAAALASDGQIRAAATEDSFTRIAGIGYRSTGGFPSRAAEACLDAAGVPLQAVDQLVVVRSESDLEDEHGWPTPASLSGLDVREIDVEALEADAVHAASSTATASAVLICSGSPAGMASFLRRDDQLEPISRIAGGEQLLTSGTIVATALNLRGDHPFESLDRLAVGGEAEFEADLASMLMWRNNAVHFDAAPFEALIRRLDDGRGLGDASSLNVHVQARRRAMAASLMTRVARVISDAAGTLSAGTGGAPVVFGGDLFASPRLNAELSRMMGAPPTVAAVPEPAGRALGAVLISAGVGRQHAGLALGPAFSDVEIKQTLDNCRLDYLYEPDWPRLLDRVSQLLALGKVVAWFQGGMGFGPRAMGTRSVLCDPSSRYVRHNVNEYFRRAPLDEPLPVVIAPAAVSRFFGTATMPDAVIDVPVRPEWLQPLAGALDWRQHVRIHPVNQRHAPSLCSLLDEHFRKTGVPALIETNLSAPGEPMACTPRDAVRVVYSSAIDALVIGQFLLMKDYWLLRSHAG